MDQSSSFLNTFPSKIQDNNHPAAAAMSFVSPNGVVFAHHQQTPPTVLPSAQPTVIPTSPFGNSHLSANLPYHGSPLGLSNVNLGTYNLNQIQQQQPPPPTSLAPPPPQPQQWSQNIPTIMPWSNTTNSVVDNNSMAAVGGGGDKFSFASPSTTTTINNNQSNHNLLHNPLASDIYKSSSANCDPLSNAYSSPPPQSSAPSPSSHNFNNKNKRNFHQLMNECTSNDFEFDFDNSRPIKKYVCEDKVLEIFDRLHIREGEHYIVEDVVENGGGSTTAGGINTNQHHDLCIEEIDCNTDACIDLSPELMDVFKNNPQNLIDKIIATEQDKINKALVVWKPNDLTKLINGDSSTTTDADLDVRIEEALSDDDDHNPQRQQDDIMISEFIGPTTTTPIEPYQEFQDQLME